MTRPEPENDQSVYPDLDDPPVELRTVLDRADYVHRICTAWDSGIVPDRDTFDLLKQWRQVLDAHSIPTSPAYHALRAWFGWPPVPKAPLLDTTAEQLDRREGRGADPCRDMI